MNPKRRIADDESLEILANGKHGVLSMATMDGIPYGVPLNYFYESFDHAIYFHCFLKGKKLDYLKENSRVSFVVIKNELIVEERFVTHYESVIITGIAKIIEDDVSKKELLKKLCEHLAPTATARRDEVIEKELPAVAIVKIEIENISGKRNQDN